MTLFWIIWFGAIILIFIFAAVLLVGAPYVPTLPAQRQVALDLLNLKKGQTLYELGSGDGSMLKDAAQRGLKAFGYEINPILVVISWMRTRKYGGSVKIRWRNFWKADLAPADGIFVFLLDKFMVELDAKIAEEGKPGVKLVSHAFKIPNRKVSASKNAMRLYIYQTVARKP